MLARDGIEGVIDTRRTETEVDLLDGGVGLHQVGVDGVVVDEEVEIELIEAQPDGVRIVHFHVEVDIDRGRRERQGHDRAEERRAHA